MDDEDKSLALGLQSTLNSLLAWIPAPIMYGVLIDSTCSIWEHPDADDQGYCMEYYNDRYRVKYAFNFLIKVIFICLLVSVTYFAVKSNLRS